MALLLGLGAVGAVGGQLAALEVAAVVGSSGGSDRAMGVLPGGAALPEEAVMAVEAVEVATAAAMAAIGCMAGVRPGGSIWGEVTWAAWAWAACSWTCWPVGLNMTC